MSLAVPSPQSCCTSSCKEPLVVDIPGSLGSAGTNGTDGIDGVSAYTLTTAAFTMPAELGTVTVSVANSLWMAIGQVLFIPGAGNMQVTALPNSASATLKNLKDTPNSAYMGNAAPATVIGNGTPVVCSGVQGPAGAGVGNGGVLSGAGTAAAVLPGGLPPNTAGSWVYFNQNDSSFQFWDNIALAWKP